MELNKKIIVLSVILGLGISPSFAKIDGGISKNHFYDTEKTIMTEIAPDKVIKTDKYWEKNLLHFNKYRPIFMLSNKELYDLMPRERVSVVQRITAPSVYNISLKTSSIKKISFATNPTTSSLAKPKQVEPTIVVKKPVMPKENACLAASPSSPSLIYEQAKNPDAEPEKKIEAAITLKNTKKTANYNLAIDLLNDVTNKEPYNAYAFYLKGELYSIQKDSQNAMSNYVEALKINPTSQQCCMGIAKLLEPTNKVLAQKYYDKAGIKK